LSFPLPHFSIDLSDHTALVTGASSGLGRRFAQTLARCGAKVALTGRRLERLEELALEIEAAGGVAVPLQLDVTDAQQLLDVVAKAEAALGAVDILVNNAGIEVHAPFWEVSEADFDKVMSVNVKGAFFATQAFVRYLRRSARPGRVINISSVHEDLAFPNFAAYCASKGAMRMLARTLAVELGPLGITINNIAPGAIETPINTALLNDEAKLRSLLAQIPVGRLGQPSDVAGLAAYLASDDARYVSGATFFIDGGLSVHYEEQ
jgi:glucose 1-dehydrogenase